MNAELAAADIVVEGHVQGVGFRAFVQRRAASLGLSGYAMNLSDGRRVRVHAEGPREVIATLVQQLEQGPRLARVERVSVRWLAPTHRFGSFDVRYAELEP